MARAIREIISEGIARRLSDPRIATLTTVSRVEVGPDLLTATVYVTVPTGESDERKTIAALKSAQGYLQRMVAKELSLRQCPELRVELDEHQKKVLRTLEQIEANRRLRGEDEDLEQNTEAGESAEPTALNDEQRPDRRTEEAGSDEVIP